MHLELLTVWLAAGADATGQLIGLHDEHCGFAAGPSSAVLPAGSLRPAKPTPVANIGRKGSSIEKQCTDPCVVIG